MQCAYHKSKLLGNKEDYLFAVDSRPYHRHRHDSTSNCHSAVSILLIMRWSNCSEEDHAAAAAGNMRIWLHRNESNTQNADKLETRGNSIDISLHNNCNSVESSYYERNSSANCPRDERSSDDC